MSFSGGNRPSTIAGASDAAMSNPADGHLLAYNGSTQKWTNLAGTTFAKANQTYLSPYSYGFSGVPGTDETSAIQATITAAMTMGGATVLLPAGIINISSLSIDYSTSAWAAQANSGAPYGYAGPVIQGQGMRATVLQQIAGSTGNVISIMGKLGTQSGPANNNKVTGTFIRDLQINGASTGGHGLYWRSVVNCGAERLWIQNTGASGIRLDREAFVSGQYDEYSYSFSFRAIKIVSAGTWGVECSGTNSIGGSFYDVEAIGCVSGGWKVAPTNMTIIGGQAIGCGTGSTAGRGFLSVVNTNTASTNGALKLIGFRSEGNSKEGGYEIEIVGGFGYTIDSPNIITSTGAHGIGIGVASTNNNANFTQELHINGGYIGIRQSVYPNQQAIVLGLDARKTVIMPPRFVNGILSIGLGDIVTDQGFQTTVIQGIAFATAAGTSTGDTTGSNTTPVSTGAGSVLARLNAAGSSPMTILVHGDSMSEGTNQSSTDTRWIASAQNTLNNRVSVSGMAKYIPAFYEFERNGYKPNGQSWTLVNTTLSTLRGLGRRSQGLGTSGNATIARSITSAKIYVYTASNDSFSVTVDNGTPTVYPTGTVGEQVINLNGLASGTHTITVSGVSGNTFFEGGYFTNGLENKGVHFWDASKHGTRAFEFNSAYGGNQSWSGVIPSISPDLVVLAHITNDCKTKDANGNAITAAIYKQHMQAQINLMRSLVPNVPIVLFPMWKVAGSINEPWANYIQSLADLESSNANTVLIDVSASITDKTGLLAAGDAIHPNDAGAAAIANVFTNGVLAANFN